MSRRVLVLAFDSPSIDVLQQGIDEGWLPTVASIVEGGVYAPLDDVQEILTTPSWPTMIAGAEVTQHHVLCDSQLEPGTYTFVPVHADESRRPPFWWYAHEGGLRTTVAAVYAAPFVEGLRGTQVTGWGTHCPFTTKTTGPRSDPPGLIARLEREVGEREIGYGHTIPRTPEDYRRFTSSMLRSAEQQAQALELLVRETDWDLFVAGFSESHDTGHFVWHFADPEHPDHDPEADPQLRGALRAVYERVDAGIGRVIEAAGDDVTVMLVTPYAMGPGEHYAEVVTDVLVSEGLLARRSEGPSSDDIRLRILRRGRAIVQRLVPAGLRPMLGKLVPRDRWLGELQLADVDWPKTTAYQLPGDGSAYVRLNLAGREPGGTVAPEDYDATCDRIISVFRSLRDADSGEPVAATVERTDRLLGRAVDGPLPDICIGWVPRYRSRAIRVGDATLELPVPRDDPRTALHRAPGFVMAAGPGIPASGSRSLAGPSGRLIDVAPTVLAALGITPPTGALEGSVIDGMFGPG